MAADISRHNEHEPLLIFEGFVRSPPIVYAVATLQLVGQTWRPLFRLFTRNVVIF